MNYILPSETKSTKLEDLRLREIIHLQKHRRYMFYVIMQNAPNKINVRLGLPEVGKVV